MYASCGFLNKEKPEMTYSRLPENRNIFDLASLTKALVTTPLILWYCEDLKLDPKAATLADLFGTSVTAKLSPKITDWPLASVLRHESGLPAWRNFYTECEGRRQTLQEALARALVGDATQKTRSELYSDIGFILLGRLLEIKSANELTDLWWSACEQRGIQSARELGPAKSFSKDKCISTGFCPVRGRELIGEVHDENCWALGGFAGHAGLFGSGESLEKVLKDMWSSPQGRRVFNSNFTESNSPGESMMGWRKGRDESSNTYAEGRGSGHLGFTGTAFWVDPKTESYALLLTNRVISARVSPAIKLFRREAFRAFWDVVGP